MNIEDYPLYARFGRELAVRYVERIARTLSQHKTVDFDLNIIEEPKLDLLFNLCFFGIAEFEEKSGYFDGTKKYVPKPIFELSDPDSPPILLSGDAILHGFLEDDVLQEGIARAKS